MFLPAVEFVAAIATALILWFGGGFVMNGTLTLGSLVAFILYAGRFFRPISDMSEKFNTLQAAMASSERIFQLLDTQVAVQTKSRVQSPESRVWSPESRVQSREATSCLKTCPLPTTACRAVALRRSDEHEGGPITCCGTCRSR